ncbi:MAG: 50S ribosomal protein L21 [Armatimonadetes bacterium]|nr:50S ribosomal protein L21 [Armatimonadota bacterium]
MYAVIRTGGKQYRVAEKSVIDVEKLDAEDGSEIEITDVLLLESDDETKVGAPLVANAKVTATVMSTTKGRKIRGFTYKPKKNVHRHYGHRQWHTRLRIIKIEG